MKCGPISSWLWACSVDYCSEHLTDGFLPIEAVPTLCATVVGAALRRATENLLSVGSWEKTDGGYIVHDYLRHNQSKAQVEADREAGRKRYQAWLDKHRDNGVTNAVTNAVIADRHVLSVGSDVKKTTSNDGSRHSGPKRIGDLLR